MTPTRDWLEMWSGSGLRLVAEDAERLYDMQRDDDVYCPTCQQQFALHSDEVSYKEEAKARHMASDDHEQCGGGESQ